MTNPKPNPVITEIEAFLAKFKNPQTAITAVAGLISAFGAIGILDIPLVGWLQGVLSAAAALVVAFLAKPVSAAVARAKARTVELKPDADGVYRPANTL